MQVLNAYISVYACMLYLHKFPGKNDPIRQLESTICITVQFMNKSTCMASISIKLNAGHNNPIEILRLVFQHILEAKSTIFLWKICIICFQQKHFYHYNINQMTLNKYLFSLQYTHHDHHGTLGKSKHLQLDAYDPISGWQHPNKR